MKLLSRSDLESAAVRAHADGDTWQTFWHRHGADVAALDSWDRAAYHRLVRRLSYLLTCGDTAGMVPVAATWGQPEPWELDDDTPVVPVLVISDTHTAARCLWIPEATA
jgi:hypothetical protein